MKETYEKIKKLGKGTKDKLEYQIIIDELVNRLKKEKDEYEDQLKKMEDSKQLKSQLKILEDEMKTLVSNNNEERRLREREIESS